MTYLTVQNIFIRLNVQSKGVILYAKIRNVYKSLKCSLILLIIIYK